MGRTKGSKNRSTLVKELQALGRTESFDGWDHQSLQTELERAQQTAPPPAPEPEPVPLTVVDAEVAKNLVADTRRRFAIMARHYAPDDEDAGGTGEYALIPERLQERLRKVFFAKDLEAARAICASCLDSLHMHLLKLWGEGYVDGPNTARNIEARAKKRDSLAKMKEGKGDAAGAEREREKARLIRLTPIDESNQSPWLR